MSKLITIDPEKIAEIRCALQVIQLNAEIISADENVRRYLINRAEKIAQQVKRIDNLLPQVGFEKEKQ